MSHVELQAPPAGLPAAGGPRDRSGLAAAAWIMAAALPLVGLGSLLWRKQLDLDWDNYRVHFTLFLTVGIAVFLLAYTAGDAANRRGTRASCSSRSRSWPPAASSASMPSAPRASSSRASTRGSRLANPVGLVIASLFAVASAFVDQRPSFAPFVVRHRVALRRAVLGAMAVWFVWTVADLPPLRKPGSEGGSHSVLGAPGTRAEWHGRRHRRRGGLLRRAAVDDERGLYLAPRATRVRPRRDGR